jgi:TonB family protein
MRESYFNRESDYRKRLLIICPISIFLIALLFITSDLVPYSEIQRTFGWQGALRIMPEITIIPDRDPYETPEKHSRARSMASIDLDLLEESGEAKGMRRAKKPLENEKKMIQPEEEKEEIRHYPAHTDVPYSESYVILSMTKPEYPLEELMNGTEGEVTVEVLVNEEGYVERAWVLTAQGPKSFEESSLAAVKTFRFKPPTDRGKPIAMWIRFQIRFKIMS